MKYFISTIKELKLFFNFTITFIIFTIVLGFLFYAGQFVSLNDAFRQSLNQLENAFWILMKILWGTYFLLLIIGGTLSTVEFFKKFGKKPRNINW